ncbi:MAG: inositol monophosphatase family protein [Gammaproteobacteria bacterium]|nr:inositol monophosphatase family protein [Gammaproteobacteria bacterium]
MAIDHHAVIEGVKEIAQKTLLPHFATVVRQTKNDGSFVTEADLNTQDQVATLLHQLEPDIPMLGEEMSSDEQQQLLNAPLLWCLDPLDGTTNFSGGLPYFSVSLALLSKGEAIFALVYDPVRDECFTAHCNEGAFLNEVKLTLPIDGGPISGAIGLVDFKRLPQELATPLVLNPPYASQRSLGSVALDWCWMAANRCQLYLHSRQKLWDFASGLLIFSEAGGKHSTLKGRPLDYQHLNSQLAFAAVNESLFKEWEEWLTNRYK